MIISIGNFILSLFVQYSYPNQAQGKITGILFIGMLGGSASLPLIAQIKDDLEHGWKLYQNALIGIFVGLICLTGSLILLAFDKGTLDKASKLTRA